MEAIEATDMVVLCQECNGVELVDKPKQNWGTCEKCEKRVCNDCLKNYHNDNCEDEEADDDEEDAEEE